jgi:Na+/H+ antiporter NhaC
MHEYGAISLIPTMVVLALAIWSHRTIESVIAGSIVAFIITSQEGFLASLADAALTVVRDENTGWVLLVCGLYGSFIAVALVQYFLQGALKPVDMFDTLLEGLKVMVPVLTILVSVFIFIEANNALGMPQYVISAISPYMSSWSLPVLPMTTRCRNFRTHLLLPVYRRWGF